MRNPSARMIAAAALALAAALLQPAQGHQRWPAIPAEQGVHPVAVAGWLPYRCSEAPVYNFYHDALYDQVPAIDRGFAYRPFYRYAAWRRLPRTYFCAGGVR